MRNYKDYPMQIRTCTFVVLHVSLLHDHLSTPIQVSLVGQEPTLYARSIADNIAYGLKDLPQELIQHAAKLANAHGFISNMQDGFETQAGEKGNFKTHMMMIPASRVTRYYYIMQTDALASTIILLVTSI